MITKDNFISARFIDNERANIEVLIRNDTQVNPLIIPHNIDHKEFQNLMELTTIDEIHEQTANFIRETRKAFKEKVLEIAKEEGGQILCGGERIYLDGELSPSLVMLEGNTYQFDISDASNVGHPFRFETQFGGDLNPGDAPGVTGVRVGNPGTAGAFYYVVVKGSSTATTVNYDCEVHNNMGAGVTIQSGTTVHEGTGGTADVTVSGGAVTAVVFTTADDYATGDRYPNASHRIVGYAFSLSSCVGASTRHVPTYFLD